MVGVLLVLLNCGMVIGLILCKEGMMVNRIVLIIKFIVIECKSFINMMEVLLKKGMVVVYYELIGYYIVGWCLV